MERRAHGDTEASDSAAHDVLAAEEFALPAPDPTIRSRPVVLPDDPTGLQQAHDVLAAEEFAMPAARPRSGLPKPEGVPAPGRQLVAAGLLLLLLALRRRRRRR